MAFRNMPMMRKQKFLKVGGRRKKEKKIESANVKVARLKEAIRRIEKHKK
jgi:hypothetical protein